MVIGWRVWLRILGVRCLSEDLLARLSANCAWRDDPRGSGCGARFFDLPSGPPPDMPRRRMRVIQGGRG
jgi:hypothetical protein